MSATLTAAERVVPSSQDLLRAALRRSERRGRQVARRRLVLRWALWATGKLLLWVALPAAAALAGWFWWVRAQVPAPLPAALPVPASASAPWSLPPAANTDWHELQLRLDEAPSSPAPLNTPRRTP